MTTLLIDADIVAYKFAAAGQVAVRFDTDEPTIVCDSLESICDEVDVYIYELMEKLEATNYIVCLSSPTKDNFRKLIYPEYKANRTDLARPVMLGQVREHLELNHPFAIYPKLEADDVMGIFSTHPSLLKGKKIIVSEDKDMKTIPGWLFNPRQYDKPIFIDEYFADYWHLYQTLVGDTTDNYKGCPGIGPIKAEKALNEDCSWATVVSLYEAKGLTEEDALVQARVAKILRAEDYDFTTKEPILWQPRTT